MDQAVGMASGMAPSRPRVESNYAIPPISRSSSLSELGLTLLPSHQSGFWAENNAQVGLQPSQNQGSDLPEKSKTTSIGHLFKQSLSTSPEDQTNNTPSLIHLCSFEQSGHVANQTTRSATIAQLVYKPSAPHLHTLVSTGTTLASIAQLDRVKERNKQLTMERDRLQSLANPAALQADDEKIQRIRKLEDQVAKLSWQLESREHQIHFVLRQMAGQKSYHEAYRRAFNKMKSDNPQITAPDVILLPAVPPGRESTTVPSAIPQGPPAHPMAPTTPQGPPARTMAPMTNPPTNEVIDLTSPQKEINKTAPAKRKRSAVAPAKYKAPSTSNTGAKRQRQDTHITDKQQPREQSSVVSDSQMNGIHDRCWTEVVGPKSMVKQSHAGWLSEAQAQRKEKENGVSIVAPAQVTRDQAEEEDLAMTAEALDRFMEEPDSQEEGEVGTPGGKVEGRKGVDAPREGVEEEEEEEDAPGELEEVFN